MPNVLESVGSQTLLHEDAKMRILRFLWKSRAEWSGREIARKVGMSAPACHATLKKLNARGLAQFRRISNVHLYKVNAENYLIQNMFARIFKAEAAMPNEVLATVKKSLIESPGSDIISMVVFGSMARGMERLGSDFDLLIILPTKEDIKALEPRIEKLRAILFKRFSLPLSPYVQTLSEFKRKYHRKLPLVLKILKDGRAIYGKNIKELIS